MPPSKEKSECGAPAIPSPTQVEGASKRHRWGEDFPYLSRGEAAPLRGLGSSDCSSHLRTVSLLPASCLCHCSPSVPRKQAGQNSRAGLRIWESRACRPRCHGPLWSHDPSQLTGEPGPVTSKESHARTSSQTVVPKRECYGRATPVKK